MLAASALAPEQIVEELYLTTLSRLPTADEQALMIQAFESGERTSGAEDVLWALLNTKEFVFNH